MSPKIFFILSLRPPEWDKTEWTSLKNLAKNVFLNIKNMERIGTAEKLILIFMRKTKLTIKWIDQTIENVLKVIFRQKIILRLERILARRKPRPRRNSCNGNTVRK